MLGINNTNIPTALHVNIYSNECAFSLYLSPEGCARTYLPRWHAQKIEFSYGEQ